MPELLVRRVATVWESLAGKEAGDLCPGEAIQAYQWEEEWMLRSEVEARFLVNRAVMLHTRPNL